MTNKTKASINESAIDRAKYELHLRRIAAIEEAATKSWEDDVKYNPNPDNPYAYRNGFKAGAKEVIEHPERYSLYTKEQYEQALSDGYNQGLSDGARQTVDYLNKNILK